MQTAHHEDLKKETHAKAGKAEKWGKPGSLMVEAFIAAQEVFYMKTSKLLLSGFSVYAAEPHIN